MMSLSRGLPPLTVLVLLLVGLGFYRWLGGPARPPAQPTAAPITGNGQPTLVEFGMDSCASCKAMHQVLDELRAAHAERLRVITVNVMLEPERTAQWKIMMIPTQILLDREGKEIDRHIGFLPAKAIRERFAAQGLALDGASGMP